MTPPLLPFTRRTTDDRSRGRNPADCPNANRLVARTVTLPLFPAMADAPVDRVRDALLESLPR
jgi:dTDP-4-amino-4,6-dideoxygalactose transaminase